MEQTETERNHTERNRKNRAKTPKSTEQLKNGIKKKFFEKKKYFLIDFRLICGNGTIKTRKRNVSHGIIF